GWLTAASWALWLFAASKWAALALVFLAAVLVLARLWSLYPDDARSLGRVAHRARALILVVALFWVALTIANQAPDAIRRWTGWQALFAVGLAVAFAFVNREFARRLVVLGRGGPPDRPIRFAGRIWLGALILAVILWWRLRGLGLFVAVAMAAVIWLFGRVLQRFPPPVEPDLPLP